MADSLVGSGYSDWIGTRPSTTTPGTTEFYNTQSGMGFENPQQLANFVQATYQNNSVNSGNVFDVLKAGLTPSTTALSPTTNATDAATALDGTKSSQLNSTLQGYPTLDQLLQDAQNYKNQILGLSTPSQDELAARQAVNQANNTLNNFDVSVEGGLKNIMQKPIALEFQQGQKRALTEDAAFTRSSLTRSVDVANQTLQTLQQARLDLLGKLNTAYGFGQNDIATRMKLDEVQRAEAQAAKEFALQYGVRQPYYTIDGKTVYNTASGKWVSEQEFFAQTGYHNWSEVPQGLIEHVNMMTVQQQADQAYRNAQLDIQRQQLAQGKYQLSYSPITGEPTIFNSTNGTTSSAGFQPAPAGGFRTDRNNNPTAMTTDVAKSLGLVEGVDYVQGDKFPGSSNLYTARLLGDPIQTTIKALDAAAANPSTQAFYTQSGQQRWTYMGMTDQQWMALTPDQKKQTVISMYKQEGGTGSLAGATTSSTLSPQIDQYAKDVMSGAITLSSVPDKLQAQVSQRVSELKSTKYSSEFEARVDYNNELNQLQKAISAGTLASNPTDIINNAVIEFGKYISRQEIEATIYKMFGITQPSTSSSTTSTPTTTKAPSTGGLSGFMEPITRNLSEFFGLR